MCPWDILEASHCMQMPIAKLEPLFFFCGTWISSSQKN